MRGFALNGQDRLSRAAIERLQGSLSVDLEDLAEAWQVFDAERAGLASSKLDALTISGPGQWVGTPEQARGLFRVVAAGFGR